MASSSWQQLPSHHFTEPGPPLPGSTPGPGGAPELEARGPSSESVAGAAACLSGRFASGRAWGSGSEPAQCHLELCRAHHADAHRSPSPTLSGHRLRRWARCRCRWAAAAAGPRRRVSRITGPPSPAPPSPGRLADGNHWRPVAQCPGGH